MKYLLDTDILSAVLRRRGSPRVVARMVQTPPDEQVTSSITLGELCYGAFRQGAAGEALSERIDRLIVGRITVLPFDDVAARIYARVRAELESRGAPIGDADTRIAAIALANGLTVVTANVRHFQRVDGLAIENWLEPPAEGSDV
jgi:tRNA(fMet)-specific endonuclease VapC